MKRLLFIFIALAVLLSACQVLPAQVIPEPETYYAEELEPEAPAEDEKEESEPPSALAQPPEPPPPPTREDYIEMLYALQHAFATGEFEAFIEAYPGPDCDGMMMPGPASNEWPALLAGVTAVMSFDAEDVLHAPPQSNVLTVRLYVSGGNSHLPNGEQTLSLHLATNQNPDATNRDTDNTPAILSMMLNTDGRHLGGDGSLPENATIEERTLNATALMLSMWAGLPIDRTMIFLGVFENEGNWGPFTEEEMIAGAQKYLGIENFSPIYSHRHGAAPDGERSFIVWLTDDGEYKIPGMSIPPPPFSALILDTPSQGDLTIRIFAYADWFLFEIYSIIDFNFLVLYNDDGTPYARLLSEQTVSFG